MPDYHHSWRNCRLDGLNQDVLYVTLIAIVAPIGVIALLAMPLIIAYRGWEAWHAIPRDVHAQTPRRIASIRPLHVWATFGVAGLIGHVLEWAQAPSLHSVADAIANFLLGAVFVWYTVWAIDEGLLATALGCERIAKFR